MTTAAATPIGDQSSSPLFEPYMLGDLQLKNRIVMGALTRCRADFHTAAPNDLFVLIYFIFNVKY